jgi:hypothetical protein
MPAMRSHDPPLEAQSFIPKHSSRDSDLYLNPSLNVDDDLFDELGGSKHVNHPLMNPHLEHIPRLRAFATGRHAGSDAEVLRRHADGAFGTYLFGFGAVDELGARFLDGPDIFARLSSN